MKKKILYITLMAFIFIIILSMVVGALDMNKITIEFDEVGNFHDGMAWIRKGDKYGYIDEYGKLVIPMIYDAYRTDTSDNTFAVMSNFYEGLASVSINGKCGFIDKSGKLVILAIFDGDFYIGEWISYMPMFNEGLARVKKDGKFGYINKTGEVVVPFEYAWAGDFHTGFFTEGLIQVSKVDYGDECKFGFIDTSGNIIVPLMYGFVQGFSNGLAAVTNDDDSSSENYGFIDKTGRLVIPMEFSIGHPWIGFSSFNEYGFAIVWENLWEENQRCGVIDRRGNLVVPYDYIDIEFLSGEMIRGKVSGKYRTINLDDEDEWEIVNLSNVSPQTGDSFIAFILIYVTVSAVVGVKLKRRIL